MTDILKSNTLVTLKKICKMLRLKNYSGLRKSDLISIINRYHNVIKLQRWIRKIFSKNELCPISYESIKYPCFAFKTQNNVLIYYNLEALRSYLIKIGDFRDPSTRGEYTDKQLLEMDNIHKYYTIDKYYKTDYKNNASQQDYFKSVYKASKNKKFYEKIKEKEQEQLLFERLLDSICDEIIEFINNDEKNNILILNTVFLYDYKIQFRRLLNRSKKHAEYIINKNIDNLYQISIKEKGYSNNQFKTCEYVIIFLYQLREELSMQ